MKREEWKLRADKHLRVKHHGADPEHVRHVEMMVGFFINADGVEMSPNIAPERFVDREMALVKGGT